MIKHTKKNSKHTRQTLTTNTIWIQKRQKHSRRNTTNKKSSRTWAPNKQQTTPSITRLGKSLRQGKQGKNDRSIGKNER